MSRSGLPARRLALHLGQRVGVAGFAFFAVKKPAWLAWLAWLALLALLAAGVFSLGPHELAPDA